MWRIFDLYSERTRRLIAKLLLSFEKSGSLNLMLNVDVRILTGSSEIAVSAHAQYKFG